MHTDRRDRTHYQVAFVGGNEMHILSSASFCTNPYYREGAFTEWRRTNGEESFG